MKEIVKFGEREYKQYERCEFCGKESTLLCDMPSMLVVRSTDFVRRVLTCDKKLCRECATRVRGFDYCPDCVARIKMAKKGVANERQK